MCQKWSEVAWMNGRQEFRKIDWVTFSERIVTELRLCTGFLRLLVASEASEGGFGSVHACERLKQVWLPNFGVCQEESVTTTLFACKENRISVFPM